MGFPPHGQPWLFGFQPSHSHSSQQAGLKEGSPLPLSKLPGILTPVIQLLLTLPHRDAGECGLFSRWSWTQPKFEDSVTKQRQAK